MIFDKNVFYSLTVASSAGTALGILLNYATNISPISGFWLFIYIFILFILSVLFSFKFLQWLLHLNKPIKYHIDELVNGYPYLLFLRRFLPRTQKRSEEECKEYDTNELSVITSVLERKLVSSWYVPYISQEIGFPFACKQMLDQMIGKTFQICNKIEPKDVFVDICSILITHLKEYRKALKRHEKSPKDTVESLYKKSHPISNNTDKKVESAEHCTNILRIVMKELVPWELWDTPHLELLVRILSKRLDTFIDSTLADPAWLNDKLLTILKNKEKIKLEPEKKSMVVQEEVTQEVKVKDVPVTEPKSEKPTVESALSTLITKTTAPILQRAINEEIHEDQLVPNNAMSIIEEVPVNATEPVDIKSSPVLRQRRGRQGRNEVKIYDRIIEGSVKTWETDIDLRCISLGQDLLASLDGEITLSRLWGQDAEPDAGPQPPGNKALQPLWFGEEDTIDMEPSTPPRESSPARKDHSPKPADALLKDLQSTVNQAKTKIGDLQVTNVSVHVPRKRYSGDEAAGMMEGLLDFGIAGLKKGLRFTGLSDDSQDKSPSHKERGAEKMSPPDLGKAKSAPVPIHPDREREIGNSTLIQKEDNGTTAPPLLKQQRVISQDSVPSQAKPTPLVLSDSPEPEYEEAADLSTSIAKLRHLLQRAELAPRYCVIRSDSPEPEYEEAADLSTSIAKLRHLLQRAELAPRYCVIRSDSPEPEYEEAADLSTSIAKLRHLLQRAELAPRYCVIRSDSPEPEYEEAADLSTSIAKLRHLLQRAELAPRYCVIRSDSPEPEYEEAADLSTSIAKLRHLLQRAELAPRYCVIRSDSPEPEYEEAADLSTSIAKLRHLLQRAELAPRYCVIRSDSPEPEYEEAADLSTSIAKLRHLLQRAELAPRYCVIRSDSPEPEYEEAADLSTSIAKLRHLLQRAELAPRYCVIRSDSPEPEYEEAADLSTSIAKLRHLLQRAELAPRYCVIRSDSPEPEYEEAADLSTSIAKLRHLLQRAELAPRYCVIRSDSPEPEYEEAADLSTSIAKLRHLLQRAELAPRYCVIRSDSPEPEYEEAADLSTSIAKLRHLLQRAELAPRYCVIRSDSPEPEYEEAADLSTSIAKLRHLLQRAELAPSGGSGGGGVGVGGGVGTEEVWWERAEETRGRTHTHAHSSRPVDTAAFADEYELQAERVSPQTNNMQQRFDKLFHRTVTGVFNSIKTAVGAEGEAPRDTRTDRDWTYVCTSIEHSVGGAVARLVGSRRAMSHVDAALDSLTHLPAPPSHDDHLPPLDLEEWCAAQGGGWVAADGLAAAAGLYSSHVTHRIATLLFADLAESLIAVWLDELTAWLRVQVFAEFRQMSEPEPAPASGCEGREGREPPPVDVERACRAVMENMPAVLYIFGKETLTDAVRLTVSSFSHKSVNKDVLFRALDLLAFRFKKASELRNPSFDAT